MLDGSVMKMWLNAERSGNMPIADKFIVGGQEIELADSYAREQLNNINGGDVFIDDNVTSVDKVWSSQKVSQQLQQIVLEVNQADGKLYLKRNGEYVGEGIELGGTGASNVDFSNLSLVIEGQTIKLLNGTTVLSTQTIPTAVITDEQLTAIIQAKIDDGTLTSLSLGDNSVATNNIQEGAITPNKTNFFKEELINLAYGLTWSNTGFGGQYNPPFGNTVWITPLIEVNKNYIYTLSPEMSGAFSDVYRGTVACYGVDESYLGTAILTTGKNDLTTGKNRWFAEYELLENTKYIRLGFSNAQGIGYALDAEKLSKAIISYYSITIDQELGKKIFSISSDYLQYLIDSILIDKCVTDSKIEDVAIKNQFKNNANNNNIIDYIHTKFFKQIVGTENLFNSNLTRIDNTNPIDATVNNDTYGYNSLITDLIDIENNTVLCTGLDNKKENSEGNQRASLAGVFCFDENKKYLGKGTVEYVDYKNNAENTSSSYVSRYLRWRIKNFIEGTKYIRLSFNSTWVNEQDIIDSCIIRKTLPNFFENAKLITLELAENYKIQGLDNSLIASSPLANKNIVVIGDSLTNWGGGDGTIGGTGFLDIVATNEGAIIYNQGTAGQTWELTTIDGSTVTERPQSDDYTAVGRVDTLIANKSSFTPDIIVFFMGANTKLNGVITDTYENPYTMCGAIHYCLRKLLQNFPTTAIGIMLPPMRVEDNHTIGVKSFMEEKGELIKTIANYYAIPTFDTFHESQIVAKDRVPDLEETGTISGNGSLGDGLHLGEVGQINLGRKLCHWLKSL